MTQPDQIREIIPQLTPIELFILLTLSKGPLHGLGIFADIAIRTNQELILAPGTLYAALKRMYNADWIESSGEILLGKAPDERRKVYKLTDLGRQILEAEYNRLK